MLEELTTSALKREQIVIISFHTKVIHAFKVQAPQFKAFWLSGFERGKSGVITPSLETVLETLRESKADGLSSGRGIISEPFIKGVMEQGYEYHVWTIDDLETAKRFRKWGAMSITTNVPGYMIRNLA